MAWLALVLLTALFIALHALPFASAGRARLVAAVGEKPYLLAYAILSLVGLLGAFYAAAAVPPVVLWQAGAPLRWLALVLTLAAFVLLASAYVGTAGPRLARHPMLAGVALWALAHVLATGALGHLFLFGALALYAPAAMVASDRRDAARDPKAFERRRATTSLVPFATLARAGVTGLDVKGPVAGVVAWLAFLALHPWLFGVSALPLALG